MKNNKLKIGVFGMWHLGCVYATSLAKGGYDVEGSDFDKKIVSDLNEGKPPIFEPGMEETVRRTIKKTLNFVDPKQLFKNKDYIFITHDLPVDDKDRVKTKLIDKTVKLIKKYGKNETIYVISSQVPLGTCRQIADVAKRVIYFPENVRLGKAYETFLKPERIILGSDQPELIKKFEKDFKLFNCPVYRMDWESAEMVKHALNSYLATCVSFSSELADLCELLGANMTEVVGALKTDKRVSPFAPINPGMGFAGATLGRDIKSLKYLGLKKGYKTKLFNAVYKVNQERLERLMFKIKNSLGNLRGKKIGILGLTYKPGTNTLRRSMSLELAELLKKAGCKVKAFDPVINKKIKNYGFIRISRNYKEFFMKLEAAVLMTEWPEFKEINIGQAGKGMEHKVMFDTKNFLNKQEFENKNFKYIGTGF